MQPIKKLKEEKELNTELTELIDALKGVAIAEFRSMEKRKDRFIKFMEAFDGFFNLIDFSKVEHPFAKYGKKLGIIVITSDEGFMGGLNTRVINEALSHPRITEAKLIVVGDRGENYLKGMGFECEKFPGILREEHYEAVMKLKGYIMQEGASGRLGSLILFYPKSISFMVQKIEQLNILPCHELFKKKEQRVGKHGVESREKSEPKKGLRAFVHSMSNDIIVESSLDDMIEYLVGTWITQKLFEVFEESKLSELSARAVSLEESHQKLLEKKKEIDHQYFRTRHELIDREMRDMFSAQMVRRRGRNQ